MLTHLSVRDLAIVETLSVEFSAGLTVLTGETGAGKSILVDALSLVLGARANSQLVRRGAERAEVTALFDVTSLAAVRALTESLELDDGEIDLHLRRTVGSDGRSRGYVNGRPVPVQTLRDLGALLVDIHGQHEHQTLLSPAVQRDLLDAFGGHRKALDAVRARYERVHALSAEYASLTGTDGDGAARRALLEYQVGELSELAPDEDEFETARAELARLSRAEQHRQDAGLAIDLLSADNGAEMAVRRALGQLDALRADFSAAEPIAELLESSAIQIDEAVGALRNLLDDVSGDSQRAATLESRLDQLHDVARKHQVRPEELPALATRLERELRALNDAAGRIDGLTEELAGERENYRQAAAKLSKARLRAAKRFADAVSANLGELGMAGGRCSVQVTAEDDGEIHVHGNDRVEFEVCVNPGSAPGPLRKVASGGELSRVSLAIQVILAADSGVPSLVFDEVDVGIGGRVAEIVGKRLREVASARQVLCITHLAQVACQGHGHLQVHKQARNRTTQTSLDRLDGEERVREVARMLGGVEITDRTLAHAREMLELANG